MGGTCPEIKILLIPEPEISGEVRRTPKTVISARLHGNVNTARGLRRQQGLNRPDLGTGSGSKHLLPLCPAAVLWCSGSHIYGVSEGQWGLLPGSARRLCRRVNSSTRHRLDSLEPQERPPPERRQDPGPSPRTSDYSAWMG